MTFKKLNYSTMGYMTGLNIGWEATCQTEINMWTLHALHLIIIMIILLMMSDEPGNYKEFNFNQKLDRLSFAVLLVLMWHVKLIVNAKKTNYM